MNILLDYVNREDHLIETVDIIDKKVASTAQVMTRLGLFAVGANPDATKHS